MMAVAPSADSGQGVYRFGVGVLATVGEWVSEAACGRGSNDQWGDL